MSEEGIDRLRHVQDTGGTKDRERQEQERILEEPEGVPPESSGDQLGDYISPREGADEG